MDKPIIEFKNVTKEFSLQNHKTFKEFIPALFMGEKTVNKFTALKDISFTVKKGETLGIIGPNGSGKSTILKLVAGVMSPTSGKVIVRGKVSPLIELGAGFHPELSGRENIFLNGAILGLSQKQITEKFKDIVDFAELWEFIDQPVKHYSSGMYMRLGFAVAVNADPEILIVDEILAVGDTAFQEKCFKKISHFQKNNKTIILVTHDLNAVKNFCKRLLLIKSGILQKEGPVENVIQSYTSNL